MVMKNHTIVLVIIFTALMFLSCGNSSKNEEKDTTNSIENLDDNHEDQRIKYNVSSAVSGWVALFDKNKQSRCYMSHDDYYSIKDPSLNGNLKEEYSYLVPLGMVLKYPGANIIWGFEGVESVSWNDANEYVHNYSPDGEKWRLLSRIEASAIDTKIYNFYKIFESYYPNDLSYLGAYLSIENWTSTKSDEKYYREADGKTYSKIYTLEIHRDECEIEKGFTTYEEDLHNVYPISSL